MMRLALRPQKKDDWITAEQSKLKTPELSVGTAAVRVYLFCGSQKVAASTSPSLATFVALV